MTEQQQERIRQMGGVGAVIVGSLVAVDLAGLKGLELFWLGMILEWMESRMR